MGHLMLDTMLKRMSEEAGLSKRYTNHCLRATASKSLSDAGNERSDICVVTGHASVSSLDPYINRQLVMPRKGSSALTSGISFARRGHLEMSTLLTWGMTLQLRKC